MFENPYNEEAAKCRLLAGFSGRGRPGICAFDDLIEISARQGVPGLLIAPDGDGGVAWPRVVAAFSHNPVVVDWTMAQGNFLKREEVRSVYQRWAGVYDVAVWLYYLVGIRIGHWRRLVMEALEPRPGDTVVEIGCGTGLNFALLEERIGGEGTIIGVDISEAMLARAAERVRLAGWHNVRLECRAAADFRFPGSVDGILSTGALTYEPEFDKVIERGAKALAPGRRWVILDYKMPTDWHRHLAPLFVALASPFGVSRAQMDRHPWESMQRHLRHTRMRELYGGLVYIAFGEAP